MKKWKSPKDIEIKNYLYKSDKPFYMNIFLNLFDKLAPETLFFVGDFNRLPKFFYYLGGFVWNGAYFGLLAWFIYTTYESTYSATFISLDNTSGICSEVPKSVTGSYKLDNYGYWETDSHYKPQFSLMTSTYDAFTSTTTNFSKIINNFGEKYNNIGKKSMYRDLAYNLIVLASTYTSDDSSGVLELQPTGNIGYMLNKQFSTIGAIRNSTDLLYTDRNKVGCFGTVGTSIDVSTNILSSQFIYSEASSNCQLFADLFGYNPEYGPVFHYKLDLAAFSTVAAINNLIITANDLISAGPIANEYDHSKPINNDDFNDDSVIVRRKKRRTKRQLSETIVMKQTKIKNNSSNYNFELNRLNQIEKDMNNYIKNLEIKPRKDYPHVITGAKFKIASKYKGMEPILCYILDHNETRSLCFIYKPANGLGELDMLMYPIMKHYWGTNCTDDSYWGSDWYDNIPEILQSHSNWEEIYDHTFDILLGVVSFKVDRANVIGLVTAIYHKLISSEDGDLEISNKYYLAMKIIADLHLNNKSILNYPSQEQLCGVDRSTGIALECFLIVINQYDGSYSINADNYQLFAGACRNSIYHSDMFKNAANAPPTPLIENYYSCKPTTYDAVFNSIGLSFGNTDLYMMVGWSVFCLLMTSFLWYFYGFDPKMHIYPPESEENSSSISSNDEVNKKTEEDVSTLSFY